MAKRKAAPRTKKAAKKAKKAAPKRAARKAAPKKAAARKPVRRKTSKVAKKAATPAARRAGAKKLKNLKKLKKLKKKVAATKPAARKPKTALKATARKPAPKQVVRPAVRPALTKSPAFAKTSAAKSANKQPVERKAPSLDRARRVVMDDDIVLSPPSTLDMDRSASAAKSGARAMHDRIEKHHETSPAMTAGDVDADWEQAYSSGDEAPGGDNMTPDQDVVDEIGAALGVEYDDDEELQGGAEISERDAHRWDDEDS
jgi:hypothetical protein